MRVRQALTHSVRGSFVLIMYKASWSLPEAVGAFDTTPFLFFANAWLPGEIKVIELAEMTAEFCLQLNAPV